MHTHHYDLLRARLILDQYQLELAADYGIDIINEYYMSDGELKVRLGFLPSTVMELKNLLNLLYKQHRVSDSPGETYECSPGNRSSHTAGETDDIFCLLEKSPRIQLDPKTGHGNSFHLPPARIRLLALTSTGSVLDLLIPQCVRLDSVGTWNLSNPEKIHLYDIVAGPSSDELSFRIRLCERFYASLEASFRRGEIPPSPSGYDPQTSA